MSSRAMEPNHRILVIDDVEEIHEDLRKILAPGPDGGVEKCCHGVKIKRAGRSNAKIKWEGK